MLNGCMRTNKIVKLHELIDLLNNRFPSLNIIKKDKDVRDINSNPWLSGFIDSDGCFLIYISQNSKICRFELSQKHVTHTGLSQLEIMSSLAKFCKVNLISMNKKIVMDYLNFINIVLIPLLLSSPLLSTLR